MLKSWQMYTLMQMGVVQMLVLIQLMVGLGPGEECLRQTKRQMWEYQAEDAKW
jgi:hypothetical protein